MPLARIITDVSEASLELAMTLRSRGYEVETVTTTDIPDHPADLEVRLEECDTQDLESRTANLGAGAKSVFVAPGALDESGRGGGAFFNPGIRAGFPVGERTRYPLPKEFARPAMEMEEAAIVHEGPEPVPANGNGQGTRKVEVLPEAAPEVIAELGVMPGKGEPGGLSLAGQDGPVAHVAAPTVPDRRARTNAGTVRIAEVEASPALKTAKDPVDRQSPQTRRLGDVVVRRSSRDARFWRIAIASAALAAGVVTVGNIWHQRSPAPGALPSPSVSQKLPFQSDKQLAKSATDSTSNADAKRPATTPSPSGAAGSDAASVAVKPAAGSRPLVTAPGVAVAAAPPATPATSKPAVTPTAASVVHPAVKKKPMKKASRHDSGIVAQDTVTHYRKPSPPPANDPNQPPIKHYSDLD
jgi:hypothetical protein